MPARADGTRADSHRPQRRRRTHSTEKRLRKNPFRTTRRWVRGTYQSGLEVSSFRPEGSHERWWVGFSKADPEAVRTLVATANGRPRAVELHGTTSDRGNWGHMGQYQREFAVDEIRNTEPEAS